MIDQNREKSTLTFSQKLTLKQHKFQQFKLVWKIIRDASKKLFLYTSQHRSFYSQYQNLDS